MMSTSFKYIQVTKENLVLSGCAHFFQAPIGAHIHYSSLLVGDCLRLCTSALHQETPNLHQQTLFLVFLFFGQNLQNIHGFFSAFLFMAFRWVRPPWDSWIAKQRWMMGFLEQVNTRCVKHVDFQMLSCCGDSYFTLVLGFPCCTSLTKKNWIQRRFNGKQHLARTCRVLPNWRELSYNELLNSDLWGERIVPKCEFVKSIHRCYNSGDLWTNANFLVYLGGF